jgi:hypothetical protein
MKEYVPWILGISAALLHGTAYIIYNIQAKRGDSKPNVVSWSVWAFMATLNMLTFIEITSIAHALQYVVGTLAAVITFILSLVWGKFTLPNKSEVKIFLLCIIAVGVWWYYKNASVANLIGIVAFLISFYPTLVGVYKNPTKERYIPWLIWTSAFAINLINNIISWNGDIVSILNPLILLLCHYSISHLSRKKTKQS